MKNVALSLLLVAGLWCATGYADAADDDRPNVVWIVIDALRADHMGLTIDGTRASPFLDSLANNAISFDSAISQESYTMASVPSYFTSKYPTEHRVLYDQPRVDVLAEHHVTIAEVLRENGYATAAFVFNPHLRSKYGFGQGFEVYDDNAEGWPPKKVPLHRRMETAKKLQRKLAQHLTKHSERPTFLYLHYRDVHGPYAPPPPFHKTFLPDGYEAKPNLLYRKKKNYPPREHPELVKSQYLGELLYVDEVLSHTWSMLEQHGLRRDNTIFVITADHGEEFFEAHPGDRGGGSHGRTLYMEQIHVPLILSLPKGPRGRVVDEWVELIDIAPTILDATGIGAAAADEFRGESLVPLIEGKEDSGGVVYAGGNHARVVVITDGWKYYRYDASLKPTRVGQLSRDTPEGLVGEELYEIGVDPRETRNLIGSKPKIAKKMRVLADTHARLGDTTEKPKSEVVDPKTHERLQALGYFSETE